LIFLCFLFLAGLSLPPSPRSAQLPKGEVVIAEHYTSFYQVGGDPATHKSGLPVIARTVFDSLVYIDHKQKMHPALAKSWKIDPSWRFIDFFLRNDVTFHNGDNFTAEDVKFSLETYMRKELGFVHGVEWQRNINNIEIRGPYQVRVYFNEPDPGFLYHLWWGAGMMPKKYREKVGDKEFADHPIGTGPFKWLEYKQDVYWKVEAVKKHFRHTPEIKTLKMVYVPDPTTRFLMVKAGEADISPIVPPNIAEVKADPNLRLVLNKFTALFCLIFADLNSPDPSPFKDIRVREAASLAIDREGITKKILFDADEPYGDFCSPITLGHDKSIKHDPYHPERAKKLLAEAGYPNGFDTTIATTADTKYWIEAIASNLEAVGIRAKIDLMEGKTWVQKFFSKKFKGLMYFPLWHGIEKSAASNAANHFLSKRPWCYNTTPEIEAAIQEGMKARTEAEMAANGKKISRLIRESRNKLFLWADHMPFAIGPRIEYWEPEIGALPASGYEMIRLKKPYR
jgi:peptide/nickel transport system substrate-binding protein